MDIIPVIDLMDGQVVHARRGDRTNYLPVQSSLCAGSDPHDIVSSLLELYPFRRFYIADINAIQGRGDHTAIILEIQNRHRSTEIWLDAAINRTESAAYWKKQDVHCVIGSESITDLNHYYEIRHVLQNGFALSLDFLQDKFLGPAALLQDASIWPEQVIAMSLNKVGSASGPDIKLLGGLQARHAQIYAAGGVRNAADLRTLVADGLSGVLIATILHSGLLSHNDIDAVSKT